LADTDRRVRTARGAELEEGNSCAGRAETPLPIVLRLAIRAVKGLDSSLDNGCALEASLFGPCASIADRTECKGTFLAK